MIFGRKVCKYKDARFQNVSSDMCGTCKSYDNIMAFLELWLETYVQFLVYLHLKVLYNLGSYIKRHFPYRPQDSLLASH